MSKLVVVKMKDDHMKVEGGEYIQDLVKCEECVKCGFCAIQAMAKKIRYCSLGKENDA